MTSVVDTSVKHFHSGMFAAPVLNGVAGALLGVLSSCLVTGFDTKTATSLVVVGGVATLSFSGYHSATVDSVVLVAGSSIAALNGEQKVTVVGSGVVKFATAEADGAATGTITFKMAPAGWVQPFTGANIAAYKSGDVASTGMILRVDDSMTGSSRVVGYEQMSNISSGLGAFPTQVQMAGGGYWPKSATSNSNPVTWSLFADGRAFFLHVSPYTGQGVSYAGYLIGGTKGFGDMVPLRQAGDAYACNLAYTTSSDTNSNQHYGSVDHSNGPFAFARSYVGLGPAAAGAVSYGYSGTRSAAISGMDNACGTYPGAMDGSLKLSKRYMTTGPGFEPRCIVPGLYTIPQQGVYDMLSHGAVIDGGGDLSGRRFMLVISSTAPASTELLAATNCGLSAWDITGPWR